MKWSRRRAGSEERVEAGAALSIDADDEGIALRNQLEEPLLQSCRWNASPRFSDQFEMGYECPMGGPKLAQRWSRLRPSATSIREAARDQSRVFFRAAQRCNEFRPLPSDHLQFLFVPSLVCYAFSIEVGLKALSVFEGGKATRGHDLKKLFRALSPKLQAQIVRDTGYPKFFDSDLDLVHDVFDVWRYVYENHPVDTDLGFLQRFAAAVQKALTNFP